MKPPYSLVASYGLTILPSHEAINLGHVSASQARGPGFETRREHSSFSLKSPDFVPVAPRVAFSEMGQARIENNLFIIYMCVALNYDAVLTLEFCHCS